MENPPPWMTTCREEIKDLFMKAVELEYAYAEDTMPRGVLGLNEGLSALHRQPPRAADWHRAAVRPGRKPVPVDERNDRHEEGTQLLRDARDRVSNGWCAELGVILFQATPTSAVIVTALFFLRAWRRKNACIIGACDEACARISGCRAWPHRTPEKAFPETLAAAFAARLCDSTRIVQKSGRKRVVPVAH